MQKRHQNPQSAACLRASAASTSDLNEQDFKRPGKSKLPTRPVQLPTRFPHARQFTDVRTCLLELWRTDVIVGGFPCQDVSIAGKRRGLTGERTGLFSMPSTSWTTLNPAGWHLKTSRGCSSSNNGKDFQTVIQSLAECGYVGAWRVLDAQYLESPRRAAASLSWPDWESSPRLSLWPTPGAIDRLAGKGCTERQTPPYFACRHQQQWYRQVRLGYCRYPQRTG